MDFGDVIFFLVFVGIIISNIIKAMKKAGKQAPGKETSGSENSGAEKSGKKTGWKNVLEQMLEEARKQMENQPESAGSPLKHPSGWEDIITGKSSEKKQPDQRYERAKVARPSMHPGTYDAPVREEVKFRPECMRCNESMKEISDLGTGKRKGLIYCDVCGEQHKYQILNGELTLKQADTIRKKAAMAPERSYQKIEENRRPHREVPAIDALPSGATKIPHQMSQADLRTAVVWSEILGKPLALRDMEG